MNERHPRADHSDRKWSTPIIRDFGPLGPQVRKTYNRKHGRDRTDGNSWLRIAHEKYLRGHPMLRSIHTDEDIADKAHWCADQCVGIQGEATLDIFTNAHGLTKVIGVTVPGKLKRATDWHHWQRDIRIIVAQRWDQLMRDLGYVHRGEQIYCSDQVVRWQKGRAAANVRVCERLLGRSNEGDEMSLQELRELSTANPAIRFAEMMTRSRGDEDRAKKQGYIPLAIALTAPSKYHQTSWYGGKANPKYNGSNPRQTNDYIVKVFARIRSTMKRRGFDWFGFRVVEAHHDGTPHWHLMLYIKPEDQDAIQKIFLHYALLDDGNEPGAKEHRIEFTEINEKRGTPTGYMTKYIAKNIEGAMPKDQLDLCGIPAETAASRNVAWARTWRIRQFQFFGSASISVWREYWRIRELMDVIPPHVAVWDAVNEKDWCRFTELMGTGRNQLTTIKRGVKVNPETGECTAPINRYGEPRTDSQWPVLGVERTGSNGVPVMLETRTKWWDFTQLKEAWIPKPRAASSSFSSPENEIFGPWTCVTNCTRDPPMETKKVAQASIEGLEFFDKRRKKVVSDLPPEHRAAVDELLADARECMLLLANGEVS